MREENSLVCVQVRMGVLFIDARGRYLAERQLYAVVAVVLNFHAKTELEMHLLGRPAWNFLRLALSFSWTLLIFSR